MNSSSYSSACGSFRNYYKKQIPQNNNEDCNLFVYGYASKLFRDDERASQLDQGNHLIPWMGNESLKIDRYDVRGYLNNLSQFEDEFNLSLSEEEQNIEKMCDVERYRALLLNEEEEEGYKEEDEKRKYQSLAKEYHEVPFKYDSISITKADNKCTEDITIKRRESLNKDVTPDSNLSQIIGLLQPTSTMKEIIYKTAKCVSKHGRQMEIIIKTRQSNNEKFDFLNRNSELNSYYESVLNEIKKCGNQIIAKETKDNETNTDIKSGEAIFNFVESAPKISSLDELETLIPVPKNCPYSTIVNNIQSTKDKLN